VGKGHLVKEIDALGGEMARVADRTAIQCRILNTSNGPAVWGTRTQNDKMRYRIAMKEVLEAQDHLEIKESMVEELLLEGPCVAGVRDHLGAEFMGKTVVLATGTFLAGLIHIGDRRIPAGRAGEFPADRLAGVLEELGFQMGRMKTGTPPRLNRSTIDFSTFRVLEGDADPQPFSFFTRGMVLPQVVCHIGRTSEATHRVIREHIHLSPLYSGAIRGVPARYCPSLEDKVMKFPEKEYHHVILEPEGLGTQEIYASGLGNSLPYEVQIELVHSVPGLEEAEIMRPAYAIEYGFIQPTQLWPTLETKLLKGLFLAGQVNGTSGYEEAAAQGLWAGINAALKARREPPFILDRSQAYLAVLVDDLVTRGVREPYRIFTSRSEYRLLLREDNADLRLMDKGYELGLISKESLEEMQERRRLIEDEMKRLKGTFIIPSQRVNALLESLGFASLESPVSLDRLLKRPEFTYRHLETVEGRCRGLPGRVARQVEIMCKYEGYLARQEREVRRFQHLERIMIPRDMDYDRVPSLSHEVRQLLKEIRPRSLGQASRISGVTPAAISALMVYLEWLRRQKACQCQVEEKGDAYSGRLV
jgi:tRNA uridine 5-carboxymethylaminomethyl modification enzyme